MKIYIIILIIMLIGAGLYGILTGNVWYGMKWHNRNESKINFYPGVLMYFILALFVYLFGKEIW